MFNLFKRFIREEDGQDFAEYALSLGAIGVVAIAIPPSGPGLPGRCLVSFQAPTLFDGLLGLSQSGWNRRCHRSRPYRAHA
jgi:hypothetical protein